MAEHLQYKFRRHRAQVSAADTHPAVGDDYSDVNGVSGLVAKFQKVHGANPVLLLDWGGTQVTKTATLQVFCIDSCKDFISGSNQYAEDPAGNIISCAKAINVTPAETRIQLPLSGLGSQIFVAVTAIAADTTLDMFISDDPVANVG